MTGYLQNIEEITLKNEYFRQVLFTGQHAQVVVMSLKSSEEIGKDGIVHKTKQEAEADKEDHL